MTVDAVITQKGQYDAYFNGIFNIPLDTAMYYKVKEVWDNPNLHNYLYFLNPYISTDESWVRHAMSKQGVFVGYHYHF